MILHNALAEAGRAGRKGLIVYEVPNYPDPESYASTMGMLGRAEAVSIVELTIPVTSGFSSHANQVIRDAHTTAAAHNALLSSMPRPPKPTLCVLYRETFDTHGFGGFLEEYGWMFDGVLLEWDEPDSRPFLGDASRHGIELVQCIGPWHTDDQIRSLMSVAEPNALVYLMSAPMTGGRLFPIADLTDCIARAKRLRSDIKVAAGFGIRTPADVTYLQAVDDLDGVIIGTAFLEVAGQGPEAAERFIQEISRAL